MKRFLVAAAVALGLGFASTGDAKAQIVYGYSVPQGNGIVTNRAMITPGSYQTSSSFYSPWTGTMLRQSYGTNVFGQAYMRNSAYNAFSGMGYRTGFYQPNYYAFPNGGYNYNYFGRRW